MRLDMDRDASVPQPASGNACCFTAARQQHDAYSKDALAQTGRLNFLHFSNGAASYQPEEPHLHTTAVAGLGTASAAVQ